MPEAAPVRIRGVVYQSSRAAAEALGLSPSAISNALAEGRTETVGLRVPRGKPRPCRINGVNYPTLTAAAQANGVGVPAIFNAIARGRAHRVGSKRSKANA
jgi:DNA-binding transcriptional LysR family regulator